MAKLGESKPDQEKTPDRSDSDAKDTINETKAILDAQKKVKIIIPSTETDRNDVKVGVNGYTYAIQRDKIVSVPESVVKILEAAVVKTYRQVQRKDSEGYDMVPFDSPRYPFQVIMSA